MLLNPALRDKLNHIRLQLAVLEYIFREFEAQSQGLTDHLRVYAEGDQDLGQAAAGPFLLHLGLLQEIGLNKAGFEKSLSYFSSAIIHKNKEDNILIYPHHARQWSLFVGKTSKPPIPDITSLKKGGNLLLDS